MEFKSPNYVPGVDGWMMNYEGYAEFGDVSIRGEVKSYKNGILRVRLSEEALEFWDDIGAETMSFYTALGGTGFIQFGTGVYSCFIWGSAGVNGSLWLAGPTGQGLLMTAEDNFVSGGDFLPLSIGEQDLGNSVFYWNVVNYKTLTDRGCIINIDKKEAINNLRNISKSEEFISSEQSKRLKTNPKYSRLDYSSFPDYIRMPAEEKEVPIIDKKTRKKIGTKKVMGEEGVDVGSIVSMLISSVQDIDERLQKVEK